MGLLVFIVSSCQCSKPLRQSFSSCLKFTSHFTRTSNDGLSRFIFSLLFFSKNELYISTTILVVNKHE